MTVLSTLVLQGEAGLGEIFYFSENMVLAYYALSFSLNVLATVLIAARLYWHKIQLERVFGEQSDPNVPSQRLLIARLLRSLLRMLRIHRYFSPTWITRCQVQESNPPT